MQIIKLFLFEIINIYIASFSSVKNLSKRCCLFKGRGEGHVLGVAWGMGEFKFNVQYILQYEIFLVRNISLDKIIPS